MSAPPSAPRPRSVSVACLVPALAAGWRMFLACRGPAMAFAGLFALGGVGLAWGLQWVGLAPLVLPVAGGFLLVGPALLAGFLGLAAARRAGRAPSLGDLARGMAGAPRGAWVLALFCVFLFLIWMTDAATLYSFMIGRRVAGLAAIFPVGAEGWRFHLGAALMGGVLALIVFVATVHGVPLQLARRATLAGAVTVSVHACLRNPLTHALWGAILALGVGVGFLLPPLLVVILPVLAFSGEAFHRAVFETS